VSDLQDEIEKKIKEFFDKKTRNASISDELENKINELIDNAIGIVRETLDDTEREIDYKIWYESLPTYSDEQEFIDKENFIYNCQL